MKKNRNTPSKEVKAILDAIDAYIDKHQGCCGIMLDLVAFDTQSDDIVDDWVSFFGPKSLMKAMLADQKENLKAYSDDDICDDCRAKKEAKKKSKL